MKEDLIYNYLLIESLHKRNKDLLDLLSPILLLYMGKTRLNLDITSIQTGLIKTFNLVVPQSIIKTMMERVENEGFVESKAIIYRACDSALAKDISKSTIIHRFGPDIISAVIEGQTSKDIEDIRNLLREKNGIDIEFLELKLALDYLEKNGYFESLGKKYKLTTSGNNYYSQIIEYATDARSKIDALINDISSYLNSELDSDLGKEDVKNLLISFIHRNIEPLAKFLKSETLEDISISNTNYHKDRYIYEWIACRAQKNGRYFFDIMKDLLLGSIITVFYNSDAFDQGEYKDIDIYIDTNILIYILGYSFHEFTFPIKELYKLIVEQGFKLKIFDFTLDEALRVLNSCIKNYRNIYITHFRINSICSFFRSKDISESGIKLIINHLHEEVKSYGISVENTNISLERFECNPSIKEDIGRYKLDQPRKSQIHDIACIDMIQKIRGKKIYKFEDCKALFLTADQKLFEYNFKNMGHEENQTIPEVFVDRLLIDLLFIKTPSINISLESLIAVCSRDVFINKTLWYDLNEKLERLKETDKINYDDINRLIFSDVLLSLFEDKRFEKELDQLISEGISDIYINSIKFFKSAGFKVQSTEQAGSFKCIPNTNRWESIIGVNRPIYTYCLFGKVLDREEVLRISKAAEDAVDSKMLFIIIDRAPSDSGWIEISAFRSDGVQIIPIDDTIIQRGQEEQKEQFELETHLSRFLGHRLNLYNVRDPVSDRLNFFGREASANDLLRSLAESQQIVLIGLRKMGKSSLLQYLREKAEFPVAYVDLQTSCELANLFARILKSWQLAIRFKRTKLEWKPPIIYSDPATEFAIATRDLMSQLEANGYSPQLGLCIDEFELIAPKLQANSDQYDTDSLSKYLSFSRTLRGVVQETKSLAIIMVGTDPRVIRTNRLGIEQNPFYQFFREEYLGPINREDCIQMIRNIGCQMDINYGMGAVEFIADITGRHPFIARQLCSELVDDFRQNAIDNNEISLDNAKYISQRFIRDPTTACLLNEYGLWGEVTDSDLWRKQQAFENRAILISLAINEYQSEAFIVSNSSNRNECEKSVFELKKRTVLDMDRLDGMLYIQMKLFRNWIKHYQLHGDYTNG